MFCPSRRLNFPVLIRLRSRYFPPNKQKIRLEQNDKKLPRQLNNLKHWQTEETFDPVQLARVSVSAADRPLELLINGSLIQGKSGWEGVRGSGAAAMQILRAAAACQATSFSIPRWLLHPPTKSIVGEVALGPRCFAVQVLVTPRKTHSHPSSPTLRAHY